MLDMRTALVVCSEGKVRRYADYSSTSRLLPKNLPKRPKSAEAGTPRALSQHAWGSGVDLRKFPRVGGRPLPSTQPIERRLVRTHAGFSADLSRPCLV